MALSIPLAGCLSDSETPVPEPTPTDSPATQTPGGDPSLVEPTGSDRTTLSGTPFDTLAVDTLPESFPFALDAEMAAQPAEGNPGRLRISVENTSDRTFQLRISPNGLPFPPTADDATLVVSESETFERDADECARGNLRIEPAYDTAEFTPDRTMWDDRYLYTHEESANCYPPGEYRFTHQYTVLVDEEETARFRWGFTLSNAD